MISARVTFRFDDQMENKIAKIFDAGIGLIAGELAEEGRRRVAVDTGALMDSIEHSKIDNLVWRFSSGGPKVPYAVLQELGHLKGFKYKFTPFMRPAVIKITNNRAIMDDAFGDKIKETMGFGAALSASRAISIMPL